MTKVILDTGPLVAFLCSADEHHLKVVRCFQALPPRLITCEPVLAEALYLLRSAPGALKAIDRFLEQQVIEIPFQLSAHREPVFKLMRKYANVPMSLADACLVRMSELFPEDPLLTLDKDFSIYRRFGKQKLPMVSL